MDNGYWFLKKCWTSGTHSLKSMFLRGKIENNIFQLVFTTKYQVNNEQNVFNLLRSRWTKIAIIC